MGRHALAMLYPQQYETMIAACNKANEPLEIHEQQTFPENHAVVMGRLLGMWNVPSSVYHPLVYTLEPYETLARLPQPLRQRVELVKTAVMIGQLAVATWDDWDRIELPPDFVIEHLGLTDLSTVLKRTQADLKAIEGFQTGGCLGPEPSTRAADSRKVAYCNLSANSFDFFAALLTSMGIDHEPCDLGNIGAQPVLVSGIGKSWQEINAQVAKHLDGVKCLIVLDEDRFAQSAVRDGVLTLPTSIGALRQGLQSLQN